MKKSFLMAISLVGICAVLLGFFYPYQKLVNYAEACPGEPLNWINQDIQVAAVISSDLNQRDWHKTAKVSESKFPSGINIHYNFQTSEYASENRYTLNLRFSNVNQDIAVTNIYPHSGAKIIHANNVVLGLKKSKISGASLDVIAPKGLGGIAVTTCQNKRRSTISIDFPNYELPA
ncbi:hypothetical protein [Limnohabitans sp. B9-3]|uniref:hypothetical protein n=1 Tax=Limnohabitans sp. B9-3 TaxID=1100707 RepID=UPI00117A96E5|nr:hypothetical protein [Limnohabitans sp. B9-3]